MSHARPAARQRYGTLLVDLETRRVVELLLDRSCQTMTKWLQMHPELEVISRDRAAAYAEAAEKGAPQAIQVADRCPNGQNMRTVFVCRRLRVPGEIRE